MSKNQGGRRPTLPLSATSPYAYRTYMDASSSATFPSAHSFWELAWMFPVPLVRQPSMGAGLVGQLEPRRPLGAVLLILGP